MCALAAGWACSGERLATIGSAGHQSEQIPTRFGFGRPATSQEIAALDIDIMPDGTGLPEGSGTAAQGAAVYAAKCAACHGASGVEGPSTRLVGRNPREGFPFANGFGYVMTVGNYWPYATTLFDYTRRAMPFGSPGSLSANEVYGLVAFLLVRNEIIPEDAVMNAETLPNVVMPARNRFVPDNRKGGPEIR